MGQPVIRYESGQTSYPFEAMTTADNTTFAASFAPLSQAAGFAAVVAPYGVRTGGVVTPTATANQVAVSAMTVVMPGVAGADANGVLAVGSGTLSITRGAASNTHAITSITVDDQGALAAVAGTASTAFSEVRGAAGGPPFIPVGSIEVAQVRTTSTTSGVVLAGEIFAVPGLHRELSDFPVYAVNFATGTVTFAAPLPAIHTGTVAKKVFIKGATPIFADVPNASDWVPAEATYSISSVDTYDGPIGSSSSSLNQATFSAVLRDGITDGFVGLKGRTLWFEFRPDRDQMFPRQLTQGVLGISRSFPAGGGRATASCTVTPSEASVDIAS